MLNKVPCPGCGEFYDVVLPQKRGGSYGPKEMTRCPKCGQVVIISVSSDGKRINVLEKTTLPSQGTMSYDGTVGG